MSGSLQSGSFQHACLSKLYYKFQYIPPKTVEHPANCTQVTWIQFPEVNLNHQSVAASKSLLGPLGVDLVCDAISPLGSIMLLVQVSAFVDWKLGFVNKEGRFVTQDHRVYFSIPMLHKITFTEIGFNAIMPWKVKGIGGWKAALIFGSKAGITAARIWSMISKVQAAKDMFDRIAATAGAVYGTGACVTGIVDLPAMLKKLEDEMNGQMRSAINNESNMASYIQSLDRGPSGGSRLIGSRVA